MAKIAKCRNCGRGKKIIGDGLCSGCYWSVYKKFTKGTPEYDAALAKAKIKFSDPNYKRGRSFQKRQTLAEQHLTKSISPENIKKLKTKAQVLLAIKHTGGDPEKAGVITTMQMERERLLAKADKLKQAIDLLS